MCKSSLKNKSLWVSEWTIGNARSVIKLQFPLCIFGTLSILKESVFVSLNKHFGLHVKREVREREIGKEIMMKIWRRKGVMTLHIFAHLYLFLQNDIKILALLSIGQRSNGNSQ